MGKRLSAKILRSVGLGHVLDERQAGNTIAASQHSNDFYLVEFPKSGITWLTVLLANLMLKNEGSAHHATFASVRGYIPDLHVGRRVKAYEFNSPRVRFYKSHAAFNPEYVNIIYLVRHPRDVMKSFFKYRIGLGGYSGDFESFCLGEGKALEKWRSHVRSWLINPHDSNQRFIFLMRYEDLVADAAERITEMARNYGWSLNEAAIAAAVRLSDRDAMRQQEARYGKNNPAHKFEFVGTTNALSVPKEAFENVANEIELRCAEELAVLGYR